MKSNMQIPSNRKNDTKSSTKYALVLSISAALAACGGGDSSETTITNLNPASGDTAASRILFDPGNGVLPLPNDLLFSGTSDGTLEAPDEVAGREAGAVDLGNPSVALGVADGWSTMLPMQLNVSMADGATIDASTVGAATVVMFEAVTPPLSPLLPSSCIPAEPFSSLSVGLPCGIAAPLTFGVDFVAVAGDDSITIAPLTPLKASTTYVVAVREGVMDSRGEPVAGSELYEQVTRGDIDISFDGLDSLQDAVNLYEALVDLGTGGTGASPADALYSAAWTTASSGDVVATATTILAATPPSIDALTSLGFSVEAALIGQGVLPAAAAGTTSLQFADLHSATISLPYYSGVAADGSDPLANGWTARCDNPLAIAGAAAAGALPAPVEPNNTICSTINPSLGDYGLDSERYLTKYNPVPLARDTQVLEVQITTPNTAVGPWPIVILQHGITSRKEDMLAVTGALAAAGFATFAIDHPLHGSRGLVSAAAGGATVSAASDATVYMNLANLPVGRDNLRQSMADMLGLRMAIGNSIAGALTSANFDTTNVHVLGMSLGGISGVGFAEQAGSLGLGLDIQSAALAVPGGGIVPLLLESPAFGSLVKGSVLGGAGTDLSTSFITFAGSNLGCAGDLGCNFDDFVATLDASSLAEINTLVAQFAFAAQSIIDPADPNNYAAGLAGQSVEIYMSEIVGNGTTNEPDQVIPNQTFTPGLTFGGTEPLAALLGLSGVDTTNSGASSGIVRFTEGSHGSLLSPEASLITTTEMQSQIATFFAGAGVVVPASVGGDAAVLPLD